ncbi:MAG: flagellar hook-associated protein 3 [Treponema sp.]|nr:flagellar hook-associated protein 3 [Treponema sp.]
MNRISSDMVNTDMQFYMRRQEDAQHNLMNQIASGNRLQMLRDDPLAAASTVRYQSYLARLERFETNVLYAKNHYDQIDINLQRAMDVMHRVRDLAVTGANGIYNREDTRNMAIEINELIKELVSISNADGPDGNRLFAGDRAFTEPFRLVEGTIDGHGDLLVVNVEYRGTGPTRRTEISNQTYADLDIGGGEAFWAERMQIFSQVDAREWRADSDGSFFINGHEIFVRVGDTLPSVVHSINESGAAIRASVDPLTQGLVITGTHPHMIRMEDAQGSSTLVDLGIIQANNDPSAPNWAPTARVAGGSLFDMVIRLRDALFRGDQDFIGGLGIGGVDLAMDNLRARMADIGSRQERVSMTWERLNKEIPNVNAMIVRESAVDMAEAITNLGMMEFAHRATLQTAARIIPPTLLDFLR